VEMALKRDGHRVKLTIANGGPGIAPEHLPHVFDRFFRGDAAHAGTVEGCGLGLAIAQCIVRTHRGAIELSSQPGQLTAATVHLPLEA
jgi:signal transduction histidine kinase